MTRTRWLIGAYIVVPGALAAAGTIGDVFGLFVAGLVLALPLSMVGSVLAYLVSATVLGEGDADSIGATVFAAATYFVVFGGSAALQALTLRAVLLSWRGRHAGRG